MNNKYSLPKDGGLIAESTPRDIIHRYEKIHTTVYENEYLGVQYVADTIVKAIRTYNELHCSNEVYEEQQPFVLGLTTGRTPLGLYRELVKRHKEGHIPRCFTTFSFAVVDIRWLKVDRNIIKCYSELRKMRLNSNWIPLYSIDIFDKSTYNKNG